MTSHMGGSSSVAVLSFSAKVSKDQYTAYTSPSMLKGQGRVRVRISSVPVKHPVGKIACTTSCQSVILLDATQAVSDYLEW